MGNRTIAIIDEDEQHICALEEVLAACGHESVIVSDALAAVNTIVARKPDLILLELRMPQKSGFAIADEINRIHETSRIPIIAMSENVKNEFDWLLNLCGINGYLRKPFFPLDVIWAIENTVDESVGMDRYKIFAQSKKRNI